MNACRITLVTLGLAFATDLPAAVVLSSSTLNTSIPDGQSAGINSKLTLNAPGQKVENVRVFLEIQGTGIGGAWNGDYYAALVHDNKRAVLLNRPGLSSLDPVGYADNGFNVTFDDAATLDVHRYRQSITPNTLQPVTGTWQPDARGDLPHIVTVDSIRSQFLAIFDDTPASGDWFLVVADNEFGGTGRLVRWGLELTLVPEPVHGVLAIGGGLAAFAWFRRRAKTSR